MIRSVAQLVSQSRKFFMIVVSLCLNPLKHQPLGIHFLLNKKTKFLLTSKNLVFVFLECSTNNTSIYSFIIIHFMKLLQICCEM